MHYLENSIFWRVFKSSLGTSIASLLWRVCYRTQMPVVLVISVFLISLIAYIFAQMWETEKSNTILSFIVSSKEKWEYCRVPYKGRMVFGALKRNGISIDSLAICIQPDRIGMVEKNEFIEMNGRVLITQDGYFILNSDDKGTILSEIKKTS